jgi:hypothetical protein
MRITIEDDYRFLGAAPGMGMPGQSAVMAPQYAPPIAQQAAPYSQAQQFAQPLGNIQSAGEPATHVRQFMNAATNGLSAMPGDARTSSAAGDLMTTQLIDIGPAPEWLKSLRVTAAPVPAE